MSDVPYEKEKLRDSTGRPLTQSLFLEFGYNTEYALFTINDEDKVYNGKVYFSLKRLYLETGDPTEYSFAKKYLLGWNHWKRLCKNKLFVDLAAEWREELEIMIRSEGVLAVMDQSNDNFQAAKWLADKGWDKRGAGRPSKADQTREDNIKDRIGEGLNAEIIRMEKFGAK